MSRRGLRVVVALAAPTLALVGCGGGSDQEATRDTSGLVLEVDQLRRDQVLERVQVAVHNRGTEAVVVDRLHVRIPGFRSPRAIPKDDPVPAGQVVYLPWPYGDVRCDATSLQPPEVGRPLVTLQLRTGADETSRRVRLPATDPAEVLQRIADRACAVRRVQSEVDLRFDDVWRPEARPDGVVLHGTLRARLLVDAPREVTQVAGAILYGLRADDAAGPVREPLASLTPDEPEAGIPVLAYAARCDGHTIGEIKKPYEFLAWVGAPGEEPVAVTPTVTQSTKTALRQACAF